MLEILNREEDDAITQRVTTLRAHEEYFTYLVRDAGGTVLMRSHAADEATFPPFTGTGFAWTPTHRIYQDAALKGTVTISVAEPRRIAARSRVKRFGRWPCRWPCWPRSAFWESGGWFGARCGRSGRSGMRSRCAAAVILPQCTQAVCLLKSNRSPGR